MDRETISVTFKSGQVARIYGERGLYTRVHKAMVEINRHVYSEDGFTIRNLDNVDCMVRVR